MHGRAQPGAGDSTEGRIQASLDAYLVATNKLHGAEINGVEVAFVTPRSGEGLR